jgi:RNA polymerase sigma factor (TIGR02999 family)
MAEITELLGQVRLGDRAALDRILELLYPELRRAARLQGASPDATLTPTVLINELYLHLGRNRPLDVVDRRHFLACAARAMRQLAIDEARKGAAGKRGGNWTPVTLTEGLAEDNRPIDQPWRANVLGAYDLGAIERPLGPGPVDAIFQNGFE